MLGNEEDVCKGLAYDITSFFEMLSSHISGFMYITDFRHSQSKLEKCIQVQRLQRLRNI